MTDNMMIVATVVFAFIDALLVGAVVTWALVEWGVL